MDNISRSTRRRIEDSLDGPCSALLVNCCQFSCCIPHDAISNYIWDDDDDANNNNNKLHKLDDPQHADWMKQVLTACPTLKLRDMILPGTHDSGSYSIPATTLFSAVGRTQNLSILQQLQAGARYLDVRVGGGGNKSDISSDSSIIWHGCLAGIQFQLILDQITAFLQQHTGEFVVLEIVPEYGRPFTPKQKIHCLSIIQQTLGNSNIYGSPNGSTTSTEGTKPVSPSTLFHETNLADVVFKQKKRCLVLLHDRFYDGLSDYEDDDGKSAPAYTEDYIQSHYGFFSSNRWMNNRWYNTRDVNQLLQWNLEEVQGNHGQDKNRLLQNQFILTPGIGAPTDILSLLVGYASLRPVSFALKLYQNTILEDFVRQHVQREAWNLVTLDFMDLVPGLVAFLISLNYHTPPTTTATPATTTTRLHQLEVKLAAVHHGTANTPSIDVTDKMRSFLYRDCVMYVTNVARDLGLTSSSGQLTLVYRFTQPVSSATATTSSTTTTKNGKSNGNNGKNNGTTTTTTNNNNSQPNNQWNVKHIKFNSDSQILLSPYVQTSGHVVVIDGDGNDSSEGIIVGGQRQQGPSKQKEATLNNCCVIQYNIGNKKIEPEFRLVN